jgi:hypothetical protein
VRRNTYICMSIPNAVCDLVHPDEDPIVVQGVDLPV